WRDRTAAVAAPLGVHEVGWSYVTAAAWTADGDTHLLILRPRRRELPAITVASPWFAGGRYGGGSACWPIHVCMAMPLATPALMDRVEPYCAIEQTRSAAERAAAERPGPSWPKSSTQRRGR